MLHKAERQTIDENRFATGRFTLEAARHGTMMPATNILQLSDRSQKIECEESTQKRRSNYRVRCRKSAIHPLPSLDLN